MQSRSLLSSTMEEMISGVRNFFNRKVLTWKVFVSFFITLNCRSSDFLDSRNFSMLFSNSNVSISFSPCERPSTDLSG